MYFEYWLDIMEYYNQSIETIEGFIMDLLTNLIKSGVKVQIGDADMNEIYNRVLKERGLTQK